MKLNLRKQRKEQCYRRENYIGNREEAGRKSGMGIFSYWKLLRITAHMKRFKNGCTRSRRTGPTAKSDISEAEGVCVLLLVSL